ncbi:MAG TPA: heavy metal-associated domain-containing protein [Tepidisphaeraceae bacterium]|nr:heavy metal-associated domain-containing protein [Tepidisphaeraceae bacterium]
MKDVASDHLVLIQIDGMHCHRCEQAIQRALGKLSGVREVEVDFLSGQASVLTERNSATPNQMMEAINDVGYRATGFVERSIDQDAGH